MIVIGVDNGLKGGIAYIYENCVETRPMPIAGKAYDEVNLVGYFRPFSKCHAYIEVAQAMPKQGVASVFKYGTNYGLIRGICAAYHVPYTLVRPKEWQKVMLAGLPVAKIGTKAASIQRAQQLFPDVSLLRTKACRTKSDGMADALLIAEYGRRQLLGKTQETD